MRYKLIGLLAISVIMVSCLMQFGKLGVVKSNGFQFQLIANCSSQSCIQAQQGASALDNGSNLSLYNIVNTGLGILSWIIGVVSVIMVIFGGFRYVISGGDPNATNSARNTIFYALIGMAVAALAQVLVHFVMKKFFK